MIKRLLGKTALWVIGAWAFLFLLFDAFLIMDSFLPLPMPEGEENFAVSILAKDGTPLRSFPDKKGVWRHPVRPDEVSPLYSEALINYEDRWFYSHPGVNPVSLFRGLFRWIYHGRPKSGGSTLTMQVARLLDPHKKSISGKLKQIFRALQLERHFSKEEILTLYMNYAPFGGPIEGVRAAGFAYLGKPVHELSHAEAALLAVLPQAPSRLRPDRHAERAEKARNKVLKRMEKFGVWDRETVLEAMLEKVSPQFEPRPMTAPLFSRRLKNMGKPGQSVETTLDPFAQKSAALIVKSYIKRKPEHTSAAVLVVKNSTLEVEAYVGSADFMDDSRYGHVDMIRAYRSPGSTLKPFLYAFSMEEGLIHSESLLMDAPFSFKKYRPGNFTKGFSGPVSASEALKRSLNIPAVDLLDRLGPNFFDARLKQGGLSLRFPSLGGPNLAMILGGVGTTLEDMVMAYTALGRNGLSGRLRFTRDAPTKERRMLTPGAAYIIRRILEDNPRPDLPGGRLSLDRSRQVAWKTGTSFGHRDAWCIGVTESHTIGVWVGRPDGTPSPGHYGRATAAPLLFAIVDSLPRGEAGRENIPETVSRKEICWPLGIKQNGSLDPFCHQKKWAWILGDVIPPTLPDRADRVWQSNPATFFINPETGLRVEGDCPAQSRIKKTVARWPKAARPWLGPRIRAASRIPKMDPICKNPVSTNSESIRIAGIEPDTIFRPPGSETELPEIALSAMGGEELLYWLLDDNLIAQTKPGTVILHKFKTTGRKKLTVMDLAGNFDSLSILVLGGELLD